MPVWPQGSQNQPPTSLCQADRQSYWVCPQSGISNLAPPPLGKVSLWLPDMRLCPVIMSPFGRVVWVVARSRLDRRWVPPVIMLKGEGEWAQGEATWNCVGDSWVWGQENLLCPFLALAVVGGLGEETASTNRRVPSRPWGTAGGCDFPGDHICSWTEGGPLHTLLNLCPTSLPKALS